MSELSTIKTEISVDYMKAVDLDRRIKTSAQLAQQSLYDMCMGFKEMRDGKLYKELGYENFEDYCEKETQINRQNVYKYITVAEKLPDEFVSSGRQIGIKKLYLLSTLSEEERTEVAENTDLENTTVKELESTIKELKLLKERNSVLLQDNNKNKQALKDAQAAKNELIRQIEELESRPIEVAVEDSHEAENLREAMRISDMEWGDKYSKLEEDTIKEKRALYQQHQAEKEERDRKIEELKNRLSECEKKIAEASEPKVETVPDVKEAFKAYLANALDAANRLLEFVKQNTENEMFAAKSKQLFETIVSKMEG